MPELSRRQLITIALVVVFFVGWIGLVFVLPPDELVERLGVENAYLVLFFLSALGALVSMTTVSAYPAIVTFAAGDMELWALGIVSGIGLTVGDAVFYVLAGEVKGLLHGRAKEWSERVGGWLDDRPGWILSLTTYVWVGFLPLANNILTGGLALAGVRFRTILVALLLGNLTFPTGVAFLTARGIELFG